MSATTEDRNRSIAWTSRGSLVGLAVALVACYGAAALGSLFTFPNLDPWYAGLTKPSFNPPNAVFGPVWSVLYTLMAVAAWRVWVKARETGRAATPALLLFGGQLVANVAWSGVFFGLHAPGPAVIVVAVLWTSVLATAIAFWRRDRIAGALMAPYVAWVSFASVLNIAVWQLNG